MVTIAFFNNKGGVGKTTLLCNVAAFYKSKGKRVLVIDADPQCNATTYLLSDEDLANYYTDNSTGTIYDYIFAYQQSTTELPKANIVHSNGFDVDLILGDTRLALMDDFLSSEWSNFNAIARSMKTISFLKRLYFENKDLYDYIFVDVGPSLGVLNRTVILFTDCFVMPMSSDIFCLRALDNIKHSITQWKNNFTQLQTEHNSKMGEKFQFNNQELTVSPAFLGYVNQQYTSRTTNGERRAVKAYDEILKLMPSKCEDLLADYYPSTIEKSCLRLANIPNFNSLIPMSQMAHKPIFSLSTIDGVVGSHFTKVNEYYSIMESLVSNMNNNLGKYGLA